MPVEVRLTRGNDPLTFAIRYSTAEDSRSRALAVPHYAAVGESERAVPEAPVKAPNSKAEAGHAAENCSSTRRSVASNATLSAAAAGSSAPTCRT
jgi:hypothetical protein